MKKKYTTTYPRRTNGLRTTNDVGLESYSEVLKGDRNKHTSLNTYIIITTY